MNLTNFDSNSANSNLSNPSHPPFNISQAIPPSSTNTTPANDSPILRSLGEKILNQTESLSSSLAASKELDPSRIKNFEHLTHELQSIFSKTTQLMQKNYNDDSSSIYQEIEELEDEVNSLESQLAKSLSGKELDQLLSITKDFHDILKSAETYLAFKERFLAIDEQLSSSLEQIPESLYSDLHGWSPSAAHGAVESLDHMRTLIKMTIPILEQKGTFTPEIQAQLAGSIHSGSFACSDWLHGLTAKYNHVLSVAHEQWTLAEKAFEATSSIEDYAKMQLYGKQLQDMQKVFAQLQKLPESSVFRWMANRLDQQMQKGAVDDEYAMKKNMRNDLQLLQTSLAEAGRLAKGQGNELNKVIRDIHLDEKLAKAEEAIAKKDLKPFISNIREDYQQGERSLERYVTLKCLLSGIPKSYEKELAFCHDEEHHFVQEQGYPIAFDELVQAEIMKLGQPKPGMFSRLWQSLHDPANWSDTTKRWVHSSLIGLQLGDQILKMLPKSNPVADATPTLSKEDQELLADERSLIGNLLDVKFEVFKKDPSKIDRFSKGKPEVGNFLKALIERYPQAPSSKDQRILMDRYETYRTEVLLNGGSEKTLDWVVETTNIPLKANPINISPKQLAATSTKTQDTALPKVETPLSTSQNMENIREAAHEIAVLDRQLQQCSRMEFLKPSLPVSPKALLELREELAILKHTLAESMENKPLEQSTEWNLAVQQQCDDLRKLEKRIVGATDDLVYELCKAGDFKMLAILGRHGLHLPADRIVNKDLIRSLELAAQGDKAEDVKDFLSAIDINIKNKYGNTILIRAADEGHTQIAGILADDPRIDLNIQRDTDGMTALMNAAYKGHTQIAGRLAADPRIDLNLQHKDGYTALMMAELEGHTDTVNELKRSGKDTVSEDIKHFKYFSHSWEREGRFEFANFNIRLDSFYAPATAGFMHSTLNAFHQKHPDLIAKEHLELISDGFDHIKSFNAQQALEDFKTGKPVFISTGFSGHSIMVALYGSYLMICNKGGGSIAPIEAYKINPDQLTKEIITQISECREKSFKDGFESLFGKGKWFSNTRSAGPLLQKLSSQRDDKLCQWLENLNHKTREQSVGNCAWESLETAIYATMAILPAIENNQPSFTYPEAESIALAGKTYEIFSQWEEYTKHEAVIQIVDRINQRILMSPETKDSLKEGISLVRNAYQGDPGNDFWSQREIVEYKLQSLQQLIDGGEEMSMMEKTLYGVSELVNGDM